MRPAMTERRYRAGESVEDFCRVCKTDRMHTVIASDNEGQPIRVVCGYCQSEHNFRGGPRVGRESRVASWGGDITAPSREATAKRAARSEREPFPIVSERERIAPPMNEISADGGIDVEMILRRIIREEAGITPVAPAEKWRGGQMVLRPGKPGVQDKVVPIDSFFNKIVMLRNRLRTLEQQVNASELSDDAKVRIQSYITGCYGSLTSFNVLFADEDDKFEGSSE